MRSPTRRSSVDFPHPEGPMTETNSPASTVRQTSPRASVAPARPPNVLPTPSISMIGDARRARSGPSTITLEGGRGGSPVHHPALHRRHCVVEDDADEGGHEDGGPEVGGAPVVVLSGVDDHHPHAGPAAHRQLPDDGADHAGG